MWMYDDKVFDDMGACRDWILTHETNQIIEDEIIQPYLKEIYEGRMSDLVEDVSRLYFKDWSRKDAVRNAQLYCVEMVGTKDTAFSFGKMTYSQKKKDGELKPTFYYKGERIGAVKDVVEYFKGDEYRELRASVAMAGLHREYYGRWDELVREIAYGTLCTNEVAQFRHALILLTEGLRTEGDYDEYLGIPLRCRNTFL